VLLVIDNYDSFTWNLVQLIGDLGLQPQVHRNDRISLDEIEAMAPRHIVISPGPCTPKEAGISVECIRRFGARIPTLGVCLGHQAIGTAYGATIARAERPMHGKTAPVEHTGTGLFRDLASPLRVARYHSLEIDPATVPADLEVTAWTAGRAERDEIQAVQHRSHPVWGVQFHPESIASEGGRDLMRNFLEMQ
jgi:anthranilate synthase/aminodeoxychorismate synthase-like glutamine amidotransferase